MDNELEVIRDEMELTRANLADKLGALETQVRETVSDATEAVSSTVEGVKEVVSTVSDTVGSVTDTLNVSKHVEQHPWVAIGVAVAAGFMAAQVFGGSSHRVPAPPPPAPVVPPPPVPVSATPAPLPDLQMHAHAAVERPVAVERPRPPEPKHEPSALMSSLESLLPDMNGVMNTMVSSLGGLAVGSLMGVIRDLTVSELPQEWKGEMTRLVDQVTTKLGGKTLDSSQSNQLLGALGLNASQSNQILSLLGLGGGEKKQHKEPPREEKRQEGAPYDPAKQPGGVTPNEKAGGSAVRDYRQTGTSSTSIY